MPYFPATVTLTKQVEINRAVSEVAALLRPDIVHIRFDIGQDWSGDWAIFFRVLLSDEASARRLRQIATKIDQELAARVDFPSLELFPYYNFRSVSEQEALQEQAWA
jgi:hypothetical protein